MQIYPVKFRSQCIALLFVFYASILLNAQEAENNQALFLTASGDVIAFRGDNISQSLSASQTLYSIGLGYQLGRFLPQVSYRYTNLEVNSTVASGQHNFKTQLSGGDFICGYRVFSNGTLDIIPSLGAGYALFSTFTDARDKDGITYNYWSDGSLRSLPESPANIETAQILRRDYSYETKVLSKKNTAYFPVSLRFAFRLNANVSCNAAFSTLFLQSDYVDNSTQNSGWDYLPSLSFGICYSFKGISKKKDQKATDRYAEVNFNTLWNTDEDGDGVLDRKDECYCTPAGIAVDARGCPPDTDSDGVADYKDAEVNSAPNSKIKSNGIAYSDAELQAQYRDSVGLFGTVFRKVHKKSRPYPIRKYIPLENYKRYEDLLLMHPEWEPPVIRAKAELPQELKVFDVNNDRKISVAELEAYIDDVFNHPNNAKEKLETYQKAKKYVLEKQ